jgi:hypothetical protein
MADKKIYIHPIDEVMRTICGRYLASTGIGLSPQSVSKQAELDARSKVIKKMANGKTPTSFDEMEQQVYDQACKLWAKTLDKISRAVTKRIGQADKRLPVLVEADQQHAAKLAAMRESLDKFQTLLDERPPLELDDDYKWELSGRRTALRHAIAKRRDHAVALQRERMVLNLAGWQSDLAILMETGMPGNPATTPRGRRSQASGNVIVSDYYG